MANAADALAERLSAAPGPAYRLGPLMGRGGMGVVSSCMKPRSSLVALALIGVCAAHAPAQVGVTYRRTPGDTLRYHATTRGTTDSEGSPAGPMQITMTGDSWMAITFAPDDTVRYWIERASMKTSTPMGDMESPMDSIIKKPFVFRMSSDGKVEPITNPSPIGQGAPFADLMSGVMPQRLPPFLSVPAGAFRIGLQWTDTLDQKNATPEGSRNNIFAINRYWVAKDSTFEGERIFIIEKTGTMNVETNMSTAAGGTTMAVQMKMVGEATGRVYFSAARGLVLKQTDSMLMKGTQQMDGLMAMSTTSTSRMETSLTLVR